MMWLNTIVGRTSGAAATKALSSVRYSSIGLHERTASGQIILPLDVEETVTCFCRFDICICLYTIFIHARTHFLIDLCLSINSFLLLSLGWTNFGPFDYCYIDSRTEYSLPIRNTNGFYKYLNIRR